MLEEVLDLHQAPGDCRHLCFLPKGPRQTHH